MKGLGFSLRRASWNKERIGFWVSGFGALDIWGLEFRL